MAEANAFLSSTYMDQQDIRNSVSDFLKELGFRVAQFERGGIYYDPRIPLDESCYREVRGCQLVVLLIGGRYGSPASASDSNGKKYTSVTRKELETAIEEGIPVLVFVRKEVADEFRTYMANPKSRRDGLGYASVDNPQVFQLLEQVYQRRRGNPVFPYSDASEIRTILKSQFSGLLSQALEEKRSQSRTAKATVNGFKLFFFRTGKRLSQEKLAEKAGVQPNLIRRLENVRVNPKMTLGDHLFQSTDRDALQKIERALGCEGKLSSGQDDDFLSMFVQYYGLYKKGRGQTLQDRPENHGALFPTKALVLDFDGTLTLRSDDDLTTWERLWVSVGYSVNDCADLVRRYVKEGKVSAEDHRAWCGETCKKFRQRGFTRGHLRKATEGIELLPGVHEVLRDLHAAGVSLFLISGSIRDVIAEVLGPSFRFFDEVHANQFVFDSKGQLMDIRGTRYDFQGKADFLRGVIERQDVTPLDMLFVGNSLNDVWASKAGVRTLCVNPHFTNPNDLLAWTHCIRRMQHFSEVLPFLGRNELVRKYASNHETLA